MPGRSIGMALRKDRRVMLRRVAIGFVCAGALGFGLVAPVAAAPGDWVNAVVPVAKPAEPPAVALPVANALNNPAPEAWAQQDPRERLIYNVSQPTLTPMPASMGGTAAQAAVILIPGGGFQFLAMDNEGYDVASRLAPLSSMVAGRRNARASRRWRWPMHRRQSAWCAPMPCNGMSIRRGSAYWDFRPGR